MEFLQYLFAVLSCVLVYVIYVVGSFLLNMRKIGKAVDQFPGNPKHWFWGHVHELVGSTDHILKYYASLAEKYPRACNFWMGGFLRPSLIVHHPDTVKAILKTGEPKAIKFGFYKYGITCFGNSLEFSSGAKWLRNRRLMTPIFHFNILKEYLKISNLKTDIFIKKLSRLARNDGSVDIYHNISLLTFDIISNCAFSNESDTQNQSGLHPYHNAINEVMKLWFARCFRPWLFYDFVYFLTSEGRAFKKHTKYVRGLTEKIICEKRAKLLNNPDHNPPYRDFLDILMMAKDEDGTGLSDTEIRDEVTAILFAGMDTTAATSSWTLVSLAEHPECQKRCQQEIDELFSGRDDEADLDWDDLQKLPYLTMCIKESLRMHSIVPMVERELENPLEIDGVVLPVGTNISVLICNLNHNPTVWKEHEKFDPERFSLDNVVDMDHFAFVPFSAGPRNCIGQNFAMYEMKALLCKVLRRFNLRLDPDKKIEKELAVVLRAKNGMNLIVSHR